MELRWCLRVSIIENVVTTHIWALWTSCEPPRGSEEKKKSAKFWRSGGGEGVQAGGLGVGWGSGAGALGFGVLVLRSGSPGLGVENGPNTKTLILAKVGHKH